MVTTNPINTRYHFGGGFIGDYTDLAVGSDNKFHALWTDTNNVQTVVWWYGLELCPLRFINRMWSRRPVISRIRPATVRVERNALNTS